MQDLVRDRALIKPRTKEDLNFLTKSFQQLIQIQNFKAKDSPSQQRSDMSQYASNESVEEAKDFKNAAIRKQFVKKSDLRKIFFSWMWEKELEIE